MVAEFVRTTPMVQELLFARPDTEIESARQFRSQTLTWSAAAKVTATFLTFAAVFLDHFFTFRLLRDMPLYLCTHWLTSIVFLVIFHLVRHKSEFSVDGDAKGGFMHRILLLLVYVVTIYIRETDLASQVNSQGPSAFLVNLCLSPLIVTAALTCLIHDEKPASWVSALTVTYSGMMLMTVCSDDGSCYVSLRDAAFNVAFTAFYGMYLVKVAQSLCELSVIHVLFLVNSVSVALGPGLIIFSQEGQLISENPSVIVKLFHPSVIIPLVGLKLFHMIMMFLHIKITGITTHVMTKNLAWIPSCIAIGVVCKVELMVSSFKAYWIVLGSYVLYVIPDDPDEKRPR